MSNKELRSVYSKKKLFFLFITSPVILYKSLFLWFYEQGVWLFDSCKKDKSKKKSINNDDSRLFNVIDENNFNNSDDDFNPSPAFGLSPEFYFDGYGAIDD